MKFKFKTEPITPECAYSHHTPVGDWINTQIVDKKLKHELIQRTCMACGERWYSKINA